MSTHPRTEVNSIRLVIIFSALKMLVPEDVFFSVAVRDGISQDNANVEDVTYVGPGLFGSSNITPEREIRQRHLQWCQHKGPKDAFQPMLFWR